jgi:hypothetical protein
MAEDAKNNTIMRVSIETQIRNRDEATFRVSEKVRGLSFGVLGFTWVLLSADKGLPQAIANNHRMWILLTATVAVISLFFDLFHAIVSLSVIEQGLSFELKPPKDGAVERSFYNDSMLEGLFYTFKLLAAIGACASMLLLMLVALLWR